MSTQENNYSRLEELDGSDYEIVDGEPNIIGWDVKNELGEKIADVEDLLFDPESRKVRYLVVGLDKDYLGLDDSRLVLVPIGVAELHGDDADATNSITVTDETEPLPMGLNADAANVENENHIEAEASKLDDDDREAYDPDDDGDVVIIPNVQPSQLLELPLYEKGKLTAADESLTRSIFEGTALTGAIASSDFYEHDHFNEDRFYAGGAGVTKITGIEENPEVGKQEVETGGARITNRLVQRQVEENINLKEEHVNVERNPVNRPVTDSDQAFQPSGIELTEHAEVPLNSKEARVVEEITLSRDIEQGDEVIRDTVRNTEVDIERTSGETDDADNHPNRDKGKASF